MVFRLFGVRLQFHLSVPIAFAVFLIAIPTGSIPAGFWALYGLGLAASLALHEVAHATVAHLYGIRTVEVMLLPVGSAAKYEPAPTPEQDLRIGIAGPLANLLLAAGLLLWLSTQGLVLSMADLAAAEGASTNGANLAQMLAIANIGLGLLNLLPAWPFDGGRILRALLHRLPPGSVAAQVVATSGPLLVGLAGAVALAAGHFFAALLAGFLFLSSLRQVASIVGRWLAAGFKVQAAMRRDYAALPHGSTVREALRLMVSSGQTHLPVLHGDQFLGLVSKAFLLREAAGEKLDSYASGFMDRRPPRVSPDTPLADTISDVTRRGVIAVMENDTLVGLLTRDQLQRFFSLRQYAGQNAG